MVQQAWETYKKPTPVRMRKLGDAILLGSTSLSAMMMGAPLDDKTIAITVFILNVVGVFGKVITNLFKDEDYIAPVDNNTTPQ